MPRAIVAGGGIAGLACAIALERACWSVTVHERAAEIRPLGAALSPCPNATSALARLGLLDRVAAVSALLRAMFVGDKAGEPIMAARRMIEPALMVTRAALQDVLGQTLAHSHIVLDDPIDAVEQNGHGLWARFGDGRTVAADLLIDAGGIWSPITRPLCSDAGDYRGYGGVVALSDPVHGRLDGMASEYWGRHERFGLFELTADRRYWFYMRTQAERGDAPTRDEIAATSATWPSAIAEAIAATPGDRLIPFAIYAKPPPKQLGDGRIICVGDAAHAMEPNLGQVACQALEDAAALMVLAARCAPHDLLPAFTALRLKRVRTIIGRAAEARGCVHGSVVTQQAMRTVLRLLPNGIVDRMSRDVQTMPDYR
jgi:2-polyprenyl-6-methoxyphenol hydroxylase-like FAD-dependent oxidoreductase